MKNKILLIAIIFTVSLGAANICFARNDGFSDPCSGSFWSQQCQKFIYDSDVLSNLRQVPNFESGNFASDFNASHHHGHHRHHKQNDSNE